MEFGFAQKSSKGKYPGIVARRNKAGSDIGAVFQHGGKFQYTEQFSATTNPHLLVKDVVLSCAKQDNDDGNQQPAEAQDGDEGHEDVEEAFGYFVHVI